MPIISVPIDSELVGELFLRKGPTADVGLWIERIVGDYLERTTEDGGWSQAYYDYMDKQADDKDFRTQFGEPSGGYHWAPIFLPNGSQLRMHYKRETHNATVKFDRIDYKGKSLSPSELAREIAVGTSRNAWRDLWIKRPKDSEWVLADDLRRRQIKP